MADVAVAATAMAANTAYAAYTMGSGEAIDATGTTVITPAGPIEEMVIMVINTTAAEKVTTLAIGDNPPANAAGIGTVTLTLGTGNVTPTFGFFGPLSSSRFIQNDGTVHLTHASSMTGFVLAFQVSRKA